MCFHIDHHFKFRFVIWLHLCTSYLCVLLLMVLFHVHLLCIQVLNLLLKICQMHSSIVRIGFYIQLLTMKNNFSMVNKLYSIDDENQNFFCLVEIISSETSSSNQVAEATVTQVLLAFHMLFINILILNLLIAVFK